MIKRNIYLMYGIVLLQGLVFYTPVATLYRRAAGINMLQISVIESVSLLLSLLLEIPWGVVADRIGYRRTMIICNALFFVSKIIFWRADNFAGFLLERIVLAVVISGLSGVDSALLYLSCGEEREQRVFAVYTNLGTVGLLLASTLFSLFLGNDYRMAGAWTVASYGAAMALTLFLQEPRPLAFEPNHSKADPRSSDLESHISDSDSGASDHDLAVQDDKPVDKGDFRQIIGSVLKRPRLLMLLLSFGLFNETVQSVTVFLNQLQYERAGIPGNVMGFLLTAVNVISLLGVFSDKLSGKLGERRASFLFFALGAISCGMLAVTGSPALSVAGVAVLALSGSLFAPMQAVAENRQVRTANRATELSVYTMLLDTLAVGTNLAFGRAADVSLPLALWIACGFCVLGGILYRGAVAKK